MDKYLREMMERQAERFRTKFGRDPGPEDPIFFDPDADEPRPFDPDTATREITEELRHAGTEAGIDPALIEAWCELGYVITEDTRHLFSAGDIAAWNEAVRRHAGDLDNDDDLDKETSNEDGTRRSLTAALPAVAGLLGRCDRHGGRAAEVSGDDDGKSLEL